MLEELPTTLFIAAVMAVALALYRRWSYAHPSAVAPPEPQELSQGMSLLMIACVTASAAVSLGCFIVLGEEYPVFTPAVDQAVSNAPFIATVGAYVVSCLAIGFYEEALFRAIAPGLFERGFVGNGLSPRKCVLYAALLSSALFAVLHVLAPIVSGADPLQAGLQVVFKFLQGMLFGILMVGLLKRTGSFLFVVAIHTCYNLLYFMPWFVAAGAFPATYVTGLPIDTLALFTTSLLLAPVAVIAYRFLAYGACVQPSADAEDAC